MTEPLEQILGHYRRNWVGEYARLDPPRTHAWKPIEGLSVLEFPPTADRPMWSYATVGMSRMAEEGEAHGLELHLHAPAQDEAHVELLSAIAHYHLTGRPLGLGHTVNFGRPWLPEATCGYGLLSLPYLHGPDLEWLRTATSATRFLWLIPITGAERHYKSESGLEALEQRFDAGPFDYLDPRRPSTV